MKEQIQVAKRFFGYIQKYKMRFSIALIFVAIGTILNAVIPFLLGFAITEVKENISIDTMGKVVSTIDFGYIWNIIMLMVVIVLIGQTAVYLANRMMTTVIQNTMQNIRTTVSEKLNRLSVAYFDHNQQGDILSRITNDIDNIGNALQQGLLTIVTSFLGIIAAVVMLVIISWEIMLVALIIIPTSFLLSQFLVNKSQTYFEQLQQQLGRLNGFIQEDYSGFNIIKLYGKEEMTTEKFQEINHTIAEVGLKGNLISAFIMPLSGFVTNIVYLCIAVFGGYLVINGQMTVGNLQAACQYVWQINQPVSQITQLIGVAQGAFAAMHRVFEILDEPEEEYETEKIQLPEVIDGTVVFDHVQFGYSKEKTLIEDLSFEVKSGQTVAIVGPTGAGKTTIINLLLRFYEVNKGKITVDGISTKDLTRQQVRSLFGMVLQDAWLYQTTISENIRFGKLDAEEYEVVDSAKAANVDHFIKTLHDGYDTYLNEESSNVSQGQKQLLTIARAIISDPKILILDEATSSVDTRLEVLIQKAMKKIMEGRTSFVIAHRLSTIRDADLILVMRDGAIVEKGTHETLLADGGFYEQLYNSQFAVD